MDAAGAIAWKAAEVEKWTGHKYLDVVNALVEWSGWHAG